MLMKHIVFYICFSFLFVPNFTFAQDVHEDFQGTWKAKVVNILSEEERIIPGTDTKGIHQKIEAQILEGEREGEIVQFEDDFFQLKKGDRFFMNYLITVNGQEMYSVRDIDRRMPIAFFVGLFILTILIFGGKQGIRSLLSLAGSFLVILFLLVPMLLKGYPPVLTSVGIASVILFLAIFLTHGFNRESVVAFAGTVGAVVITGVLAYAAVYFTRLTGFAADESVYLNFNTRGTLDFAGLLLGGIMIGVLGVLDDIAVTQAAVVSELYNSGAKLSKSEVYQRALRVGREHVGALVNTLALAYTGASLPLLLFFSTSDLPITNLMNMEVFASEIVRIVIGSIGLVLTVPITTLLAAYMLENYKGKHHLHTHSHLH